MLSFEIYALGDRGLTVSFGNTVNEQTNNLCVAFAEQLQSLQLKGIRDIVPAYTTVSVYYDPIAVRQLPGVTCAQTALINKLNSLLKDFKPKAASPGRKLSVPVCYHDSLGIDLEILSEQKQLTVEEIIQLHTSKTYRVYMLGFLPGFPYMGTVPEQLITQRKQQPHMKLKPGSVGIAGVQTGIYPLESPGGWNIIGRTPIKLFEPHETNLTYFRPGDEVSFYAISLEEFNQLQHD